MTLPLRSVVEHVVARMGGPVDGLFIRFAFGGHPATSRAVRDGAAQRLAEIGRFYRSADDEGRLFPEPEPARLREKRVCALAGGRVVDIAWPSAYEPLHEAYARTLERAPENMTGVARWYRHDDPAPVLICLHGYGGGHFAIEERAFAARWLYGRGCDPIVMTLPFHAARSPRGRRKVAFPSANPVRANEGFAQVVCDIRALMAALRRWGAPRVGLAGMSLGGFTSALMATVVSDLDYVVPMIPFASLPVMLWEHGRESAARRRAEREGIDLEQFAAAFVATTPLCRAPTIDPARMLIVVGERDRVTPPRYGRRLHEHFAGSRLMTFPGSHLIQVGRRQALRAVVEHVVD